MAGELAPFQRVLSRLGIAANTDEAAEALILLRAISDEVRSMTNRPFEGVATVYDVVLDKSDQFDLILPAAPVSDVLSIAAVNWDSTEEDIYTPEPVSGGVSTTLAAAASADGSNLKVASVAGIEAGDHLSLTSEVVRVTTVGTAGAGGTGLDVEPALRADHADAAAVAEVSGSTTWRLVSASRGKVEVRAYARFLRVVWRTTGDVPSTTEQYVVDWCAGRWADRARGAGSTGYSTGDDSETWDAATAGQPSADVSRGIMRDWRNVNNGVV